MAKKPMGNQQLHLRNMPAGVVRKFRTYCLARGVPMNRAVAYLMRETIKHERKVTKQHITPFNVD